MKSVQIPETLIAMLMAVALVVIGWIWLQTFGTPSKQRRAEIRAHEANHTNILAACREVLQNRDRFTDEMREGRQKGPHILLHGTSEQFRTLMPKAIQELQPPTIIIATNYVQISLATGTRASILGFEIGAQETGTVELIDGLWFWKSD